MFWDFQTVHFDRLYDCSGVNYFEETPEGTTKIRLTGSLVVYPQRVPGIPRLLARRLSPAIEKFLIELVTPNLRQLPAALQTYLDAR